MKIDRQPRPGCKTAVEYRCYTESNGVYREVYVDDRDVVEMGYEKAIDIARRLLEGEMIPTPEGKAQPRGPERLKFERMHVEPGMAHYCMDGHIIVYSDEMPPDELEYVDVAVLSEKHESALLVCEQLIERNRQYAALERERGEARADANQFHDQLEDTRAALVDCLKSRSVELRRTEQERDDYRGVLERQVEHGYYEPEATALARNALERWKK